MPRLHSLYLNSCSITNATFQNLSAMRLRHLEIEGCQGITEEGVRALKNCSSLVRVALTSCAQIPPVNEFKKRGFHFNLIVR